MMICRISVICLILLSTNLIIGCSGIRSVRDTYGSSKITYKKNDKVSTKVNQVAMDETFLKVNDEDAVTKYNEDYQLKNELKSTNHIHANTSEYFTPPMRLPTIREQMKIISDEQSEIKSDLTSMKNDISDINVRLKEIASAIDFIKSGKEPVAAKGEESIEPTDMNNSLINAEQKESIILSDEAAGFIKNNANHSTNSFTSDYKKKSEKKSPDNTLAANLIPSKSQNQSIKNQMPDTRNSKSKTPNSHPLISNALTSFEQKNYLEAIDKLKNILNKVRNPTVISDCNYWIAESYFNLQKYSDALKHYQLSLRSTSSDKIIHSKFMIAETYNRIGQTDKAKDVYKNVVAQYPQSDYVPQALKMLQKL